jgi:hypothetical protein
MKGIGWEVDGVGVGAGATEEVVHHTVVVTGVVVGEILGRLIAVGECLVVPDMAATFLALASHVDVPLDVEAVHNVPGLELEALVAQ